MKLRLGRSLLASLAGGALVAGGASAAPYAWTLSGSNTDPSQHTGVSGLTATTVYLWVACDAAVEGVASAEFGILCTQPVSAFSPTNGFSNSGTPDQPRLSHAGCPTGQRLAGSFTVSTLLGAAFNMCIVFSSGGKNETITCAGNAYPNDVIGFSTDGTTPCGSGTPLCRSADVAVDVAVDDATPTELIDSFRYTVTVTNLGPLDATGVVVADSILAPLVYESHLESQGSYDPSTGLWDLGDLALSETADLSITVHADAGSAGIVVWNRARRLASSPFDPGSGRANDVDSVSVAVQPRPQADLYVSSTVLPAIVCETDTTTFTILVGNSGADAATSVQAVDLLGPGMTYASHTVSQGGYDVASGVWSVGDLAAATEATLALTVTADAGTGGASLANIASVSTRNEEDPDSTNDVDSTSCWVRATGATSTFEPATATPDSAATFRLDFGDDSEITGVTLYYRNGGVPDSSSLPMTAATPGTWAATVPGPEVGRTGMQIWAQVTSTCTTTRVPASGVVAVAARIADPAAFTLPPAHYALLGVPFVADDATPTALFDELAPYDTRRWRYGTWNGDGYGDGPGLAKNATPGQAFWIYAEAGATIAASGWTTTLAQDFVLVLPPGWNQIANPFGFALDFAQLGRPPGVSDDLVSYDGAGYVHFTPSLEPGKGYWLRNTTSSPLALTFPASPAASAGLRDRQREGEPAGWEVSVDVEVEGARDGGNLLGMRLDAADGPDRHDYAEAPAPPGASLVASWGGGALGPLQTDFRALREPGATWELILASTLRAAPFHLVVSVPRPLPDGWEGVILDPSGLGKTALRDGAEQAGRTLLGLETQVWHLIVGRPEFVAQEAAEVRCTAGPRVDRPDLTIAPNPLLEGRTVLTLTLPAPDVARVRVYDVAGRLVRELHAGPLPAGRSRLLWEAGGVRPPIAAGVYFVRLDTPSTRVARKAVVR